MRGGRSLQALDDFARRFRAGETGLAPGGVAFVALCVDDEPTACRTAHARWPHLAHFWLKAADIAAARVAFVPNRAVVTLDRAVVKWWDGSHGNVLRGPHGLSRANGSQSLVAAIEAARR